MSDNDAVCQREQKRPNSSRTTCNRPERQQRVQGSSLARLGHVATHFRQPGELSTVREGYHDMSSTVGAIETNGTVDARFINYHIESCSFMISTHIGTIV